MANGLVLDVAQGQHVACTFRNQPVFIDLSVTKTDGKVDHEPRRGERLHDQLRQRGRRHRHGDGRRPDGDGARQHHLRGGGLSGLELRDGAPAGTSCTLNVGSLAPGAGGTAHFKVRVVDPVGAGVTQIANTVTVTGTGTERDLGDQTATDTDNLAAAPLLSVLKSDEGVTAVPGGLITYSIDYTERWGQGRHQRGAVGLDPGAHDLRGGRLAGVGLQRCRPR